MILFRIILIVIFFDLQFIFIISCPINCVCKDNELKVSCTDKSLTSVPQGLPIQAEELDLTRNIFNNLSSNAFANLTKLRVLRLDHCEIKFIAKDAFKGLEKLRDLYLTNNDLELLHQDMFKDHKSLLHLYLGYNEFQSIPALKSFSMTRLLLENNHISSAFIHVSFKVNTALRTVVLNHNMIKSLTGSDLINLRNTGLQSLMLKWNNLTQINPSAFIHVKDSLQTLELEGNELLTSEQLEVTLRAFDGGGKLIFLDLRRTGLRTISNRFFKPLVDSHLHRIDIGDNARLSVIDEDAFEELERVQVLVADHCGLVSARIRFSALTNLRQVNLSSNKFVQCPHRLPGSVEMIDLSHNDIRHILSDDFKSLSSLQLLSLSNNSISSIELNSFSDLAKLTVLDLSHNRLNIIQPRLFYSLFGLSTLKLNNQSPCLKRIYSNSFRLPNLVTLNLDTNCLDQFTVNSSIFRGCPRLANISLVGNTINFLGERFFVDCHNLSVVNLSHNQITGWSPRTFVAVKSSIIGLDLSFNNLNSLSIIPTEDNYLPKDFAKLQRISLANNHWHCSCSAVQWLLANRGLVQHQDSIICEYPIKRFREKLFDISDMKECHFQHVSPGLNLSQVSASSRAGYQEIYAIIPAVVLLFIAILFRERLINLYKLIRKQNQNNPNHYYHLPKSTETTVFSNNIMDDDDIPNIGYNSLAFDGGSLFDVADLITGAEWLGAVRESSYDGVEDIVFISSQNMTNIDTGQLTVTTIRNLQSFDNKVAAYHAPVLVIDYPPLDKDLLKIIVMERDQSKRTFVFYNTAIDEQDEICQLLEEHQIVDYSHGDIVDRLYELFT